MPAQFENLFSPIKIGAVEVKNRIAMSPMGAFSPRIMNQKTGAYTKDGADYYIARAKGGTGLIVTGLVPIIPHLPYVNPLLAQEAYVEEMKYLTSGVHEYGAKIFIQLTAMTGRVAHLQSEMEWKLLPAPTPIQNVWDPRIKNRGMSAEEIKVYVENFGIAAALVKEAGGDGVDIHAVHEGYLLDQFAISFFNKRDDEYGGSLENRLRFAKEVVESVKAKCGADFPVSLRYSVRSYIKDFNRGALPGEEFEEKGRDLEESLEAAKLLESYGYDLLNCDNGSYDSWFWAHPPMYMPKACNLADVAKIKEVVGIPVTCAGRFDDAVLANEAIGDGRIDLVGMGRPLLADPEYANKVYAGKLDDVRPCISCHQGCLGRIFQDKDISCAVNPACGREESYALKPAEKKKKVLVIGGGLGGMEAARVSALRGHAVDLYEKTDALGGVLVVSSIPDFKEDDRHLLAWYKKQLDDAGVNIYMNSEATAETVKGYDEVFVSTGATERKLDIPGLTGPSVTYAIDTLKAEKIEGENVLIVGGGLTGCEIAYMLGREGKNVTIVEMTGTIVNAFGLSAANYNMLMELLEYYKVKVVKNAVVESYKDGIATVVETVKNEPNIAGRAIRYFAIGPEGMPKKHEIAADHVVLSVGYIPNDSLYQEVKGDNVYLIGDAKKPTNIMESVWAAYEIAKDI